MKAKDFTVGTQVALPDAKMPLGIVICNSSRQGDEVIIIERETTFQIEVHNCNDLIDWSEKPSWEKLYEDAVNACEKTYAVIDDITGWSGGGGNWPAQDASIKIQAALKALKE